MFTGVVYATAAAQLMKMIYVSSIKRLTLPKQIRHPPFTMITSAYISNRESILHRLRHSGCRGRRTIVCGRANMSAIVLPGRATVHSHFVLNARFWRGQGRLSL